MSFSVRLSFLFLSSTALLRAQTATPPGPPPAASSPVEHLEKLIVSAGPQPKDAFDLAQGTAVLAGEELRRLAQGTLGETLSSTPGVSATSYGPGASRPVIRGLGGDRVRVLANGIGALDVSNVSPDHNAAIEPLFASRIEVLRGPSTLLYGGSAVGGVVNVFDNAIPEEAPDGRARGALEIRGGGAAREQTGVLTLGGGARGFATQVNAVKRTTANLRIPGVARIDAEAPAVQPAGTLPDSATETFSGSLGAGLFWAAGRAGAALTHYDTRYGVPTDEPGLGIRMRQTRLNLAGEITQPFGPFRGANTHAGFGDYTHSEVSDGATVNTTFRTRAAEGRLEFTHGAGPLTGTLGVQGARSDVSAAGAEVVFPASLTEAGALFALEELKFGSRLTVQLGGRLDAQRIALGAVDPTLPPVAGYAARSGQRKKHVGASASAGVVYYPAKDWSLGAALAYTERLPTAQELFSHGPHGGTAAYEIGGTGLRNERSLGFDVSLRRRAGFVTGALGVFVNRFAGYIFQQELPALAIPAALNPEGLTPFQYVAADAEFRGGEAELTLHFIEKDNRTLHLDLFGDTVRASLRRSGEALPRIPPVRYGARLHFEDGRWHLTAEVRRAQSQTRAAPGESSTAGYTLVNASANYLIPAGRVNYELFLRGQNLGHATAREHASFLKEFAPLPGRGVVAGVRVIF